MAQRLRTADIDDKPAQYPKPVLRMPPSATEGHSFEQTNTASIVAAEEVQRTIGAATRIATSRLSDLYRSARAHTANSCEQLATTCQSVASRTLRQVSRTKQEQPLRLFGIMAGVAFAAGIAVRIWRSSHE
jgi:hypothetical protein